MKPGITVHKHGVDFAVHSTAAEMTLLLFDTPQAGAPAREIPMRLKQGLWHASVPNLKAGQFYLYRIDDPDSPPPEGCPEGAGWVLDPCAHALHTPRGWGERPEVRGQGSDVRNQESKIGERTPDTRHPALFPKCVIVDHAFDWSADKLPQTPSDQTIIYETHLRGFTAGGSHLDFIKKIPYLKELGITAVEFLPLFEFNELEYFVGGGPRAHLLNFWGYSTRGFFAPMSRYASSPKPAAAVTEFKTLVKALHAAGIEIILDVVFNHTAEGEKEDTTYHFRGLDEDTYYLKDPDGTYQNWSGCGNTVNANHPVARQFIIECLKYWVREYHIDGFRFDLATSLCRGEDGKLLENPPLFQTLEKEPALKHTKLIAEAWDCGGYQVGHFPGKRFADWNGKFRDDVRRFWNHGHAVAGLATRLAGSSDLYGRKDGGPLHSINFITAHDGFTLADLVSYEHKHNEANGEENRDGENHNDSVNFGIEGPTDHPEINARRLLQQKNLLATLFLSQGVPMLLAGDEFGRTQQGNNNAYCQDNEISWLDWSLLEQNKELFDFTKQLIALRKAHPVLRHKKNLTEKEVQWFGPDGNEPDWQNARALGMHLAGPDRRAGRGRLGDPSLPQNDLLILINNEEHEIDFSNAWKNKGVQAQPASKDWKLELSTAPGDGFTLPPHSLAVYTK